MFIKNRTKEVADEIEIILNQKKLQIASSHFEDLIRYISKERKRFFAFMILMGMSRESCRSLTIEINSGSESDLSVDDKSILNKILKPESWNSDPIKSFDYGVLKGACDSKKMAGWLRLFIKGANELSPRLKDQYPSLITCSTEYLKSSITWPRLAIERIVSHAVRGEASRERGDRWQSDVVKTLKEYGIVGDENRTIKDHKWDWVYEDEENLVLLAMQDTITTSSDVTNKSVRHSYDIKDVKSTRKSRKITTLHLGSGAGLKRRRSDLNRLKENFDKVFKYTPSGVADLVQFLQRDIKKIRVISREKIVQCIEDSGRL